MNKIYRVKIYYEGAIYFDIEANDEMEAQQLAEKMFDETNDREIVANLEEIVIDEAFEVVDLDMKNKINSKVLSYIADHNNEPLDFMYAIMNEADLTDETALCYLWDSFGYKYTEDELKEIITKYHEEND